MGDSLGQGLHDLRNEMGGGDEVEVMTPLSLKPYHLGRQLRGRDGFTLAMVTDVGVLTEDAAQVTTCEKDGSRSPSTHERALFPEVGAAAGDNKPTATPAETLFVLGSVHPTTAGAKATFGQHLAGRYDPLLENSLGLKR